MKRTCILIRLDRWHRYCEDRKITPARMLVHPDDYAKVIAVADKFRGLRVETFRT